MEQLKEDTAIAAADTLLLTVPNQLGVDYNAHAIDSILRATRPPRNDSAPIPPRCAAG